MRESPSHVKACFSLRSGDRSVAHNAMATVAEHVFGLRNLEQFYSQLDDHPRGICPSALQSLNVVTELDDVRLRKIPLSGPLVVVANHPFGALDGLLLGEMLGRVRSDVRLLANFVLSRIPEMVDLCFFVDPFDQPGSRRQNIASLRGATRWLSRGGVLVVFPAGEVSHMRWRTFRITDSPWNEAIGRLILKSGASVLPVFIEGGNSRLFQTLGLLSPWLRTAMLARELLNKRDHTVSLRIGTVTDDKRLADLGQPRDVIDYLRVRTFMLRRSNIAEHRPYAEGEDVSPIPVAPARSGDRLADEIERLPPACLLAAQGKRFVFAARAAEIPLVLDDIGRLREHAFREVGEGTGHVVDRDRFDATYVHLFVWDASSAAIAGAYRMGLTDEALETGGVDALYTSTLFRYGPELLEEIGPAIELGRSFVATQYQRAYWPLHLLWRGIGRFIAAHPRYRRLFGPVSISAEYQSMSKRLLLAFLENNRHLPSLGRMLKPRTPVNMPAHRDWDAREFSVVVRSLDEVERLVRELEADLRGVPVLMRQYLRLHSKLLGFNIDPQFGRVIDALFLTDLDQMDRRLLDHYMGQEHAARFLAARTAPCDDYTSRSGAEIRRSTTT